MQLLLQCNDCISLCAVKYDNTRLRCSRAVTMQLLPCCLAAKMHLLMLHSQNRQLSGAPQFLGASVLRSLTMLELLFPDTTSPVYNCSLGLRTLYSELLIYLQYLISTLADVITLQLYPLGEGGSCVECWVFPCPDCPVTLAVTSHHPRCRMLLLQLETQQIGFECLKIIYFHIISSSMFKSTDS